MSNNSLDSIRAGASSRHNIDEVFLDYSDFNRGAKLISSQKYIWMYEILQRGWMCGSNITIKCFLSDYICLRRFIHCFPQLVVIISILQYAAIKSDYFLFVLTQKVTREGTLNVDSLERACCKVSLWKKIRKFGWVSMCGKNVECFSSKCENMQWRTKKIHHIMSIFSSKISKMFWKVS